MQAIDMKGFVRISKNKARKMYNDGKTIRVVPSKYRPNNEWIKVDIERADVDNEYKGYPELLELYDFDYRINNFEHYNCVYETGYYAAYYIKKE